MNTCLPVASGVVGSTKLISYPGSAVLPYWDVLMASRVPAIVCGDMGKSSLCLVSPSKLIAAYLKRWIDQIKSKASCRILVDFLLIFIQIFAYFGGGKSATFCASGQKVEQLKDSVVKGRMLDLVVGFPIGLDRISKSSKDV